ncbi:Dabb family protein [Flavihumibacter profundi]|uniref:Dabb family protein n=1 Tax=Flavihumibacter profundi TaxID=2716883 RepID=UPI001CC4F7B6|nr:Dabb family protein [Flavihumibacter profundi]MBZ5858942.1 Dabb family protein [Flavihumibacter profundi]
METQTRQGLISETGNARNLGALGAFSSAVWENQLSHKFIHHVYFWLKHPDSANDKKKLIEGLKKLARVKTIRMSHIGIPAATRREVIDTTYSVSWLLVFDNAADQESYQKDADHLKFIEECSMLWQKVVVYDAVEEA